MTDHQYIQQPKAVLCDLLPAYTAAYVHIYCDELRWSSKPVTAPYVLTLPACRTRAVHIYARSFLPDMKEDSIVRFDATHPKRGIMRFRLAIFYETSPTGLRIGHTRPTPEWRDLTTIERPGSSACAGILVGPPSSVPRVFRLASDRLRWSREIPEVPLGELTPVPIGKPVVDPLFPTEPRLMSLLEASFREAVDAIFGDDSLKVPEAVAKLRFIVRCTRRSTIHGTLCNRSAQLVSWFDLYQQSNPGEQFTSAKYRFRVPSFSDREYITVLQSSVSYLTSLEALRVTIDQVMTGVIKIEQKVSDSSNAQLTAMTDSTKSVVQVDKFKDAVVDAINTVKTLRIDSQSKVTEVNAAFSNFEAGAKRFNDKITDAKYKDRIDKGFKLFTDAFKGIAGVLKGDIGGLVDLATNVYDTVNSAVESKNAMDNFEIRIKNFTQTLPSLISDVNKATESWKPVDTVEDVKKAGAQQDKLIDDLANSGLDYFALRNRWDDFAVDVPRAFVKVTDALGAVAESLKMNPMDKTNGISGMGEFQDQINKLIIRGKTVLDAEKDAADSIDKYLHAVAEDTARNAITTGIKALAAKALKTDTENLKKDKAAQKQMLAAFDGQIAAYKPSIFTVFVQVMLAYMYRAGETSWPTAARPKLDMDGKAYQTALTTVQTQWLSKGTSHANEQDGIEVVITTDDPLAFPKDWRDQLRLSPYRGVPFEVPKTLARMTPFYHLRVSDMWAEFTLGEPVKKTAATTSSAANTFAAAAVPTAPAPKPPPPTTTSSASVSSTPSTSTTTTANSTATSTSATTVPDYWLQIGPHMLDKTDAKQHLRYTIAPRALTKINGKGKWTKGAQESFVSVTGCCSGRIALNEEGPADRAFAERVVGIKVTLSCDALGFR